MTGPVTAVFDGADGLRAAVGSTLGPTVPRVVDQAAVDTFADLTDDHQWIHVDVPRATESAYGGTVAHGFLVLSLCAWVLDELREVRGFGSALNYGLDKVRFPAALPTGAAVEGTLTLAEVHEHPRGLQALWRVALTVPGAPRPVCVAEMRSLYVA